MSLRALPKVEFHRHLDGSIRFDTILELARKNGVELGNPFLLKQKLTVTRPFETLQEVLDCFWTTQKVMVNFEAMKRIAFENVEDCFRDGVVLAELRFAPVFIMKDKALNFDEVFEGVIAGVKDAMDKYPIQAGLIHILPRGLDSVENVKSTNECLRYAKRYDRLVGFDLADPETETSFAEFEPLVAKARSAGMGITIHSGEDTTPDHMRRTLKTYSPTRIGHGIQAIHDRDLMKELKDRDVFLEICPTSNWLTGQVPTTRQHPFRKFWEAGVPVTLNSDDPHLMGIDLVDEYEIAVNEWGFKEAELVEMNRNALRASFLPKDVTDHVANIHFKKPRP